MDFSEGVKARKLRVGVIGLGYVGLPLAVAQAKAGYTVVGFDVDAQRIRRIGAGTSPVEDVSDAELAPLVASGRLVATGDFQRVGELDALSICVPTPLDAHKEPDLSFIERAIDACVPFLRAGQLIVLESTTYPGTTEEILKPRIEKRGFRVGVDFHLAFSPERIDPGNRRFGVREIPKVVGGCTPACTRLAGEFYGSFLAGPIVPVSSPKTAEMVKLLENVFRIVNVSLVNELAMLCDRMGIDVWEVIEAAKTKPFGFMPFYPGPGMGGHCIPLDPFYLSWKAKEYDFSTKFIELAGEINNAMPEYVVDRVLAILNEHGRALKGSRVLVLGLAYKKDVGDLRESTAVKVTDMLVHLGADVRYHDPYVGSVSIQGRELRSVALTPQEVQGSALVIVLTDHSGIDYSLVAEHAVLVYDTRNALKGAAGSRFYRLGSMPTPRVVGKIVH